MRLLILVCIVFSTISCALATPPSNSGQCRKTIRRNAGSITYASNHQCLEYTWIFKLNGRSTFILRMSPATEHEIQISTKTSNEEPFTVLERTETHIVRIRPPTSVVKLFVRASENPFRATYKVLSRPNLPRVQLRGPILSASRHRISRPPNEGSSSRCRLGNPSVMMACTPTDCTFSCRAPNFIPTSMDVPSVMCSELNWREKVENLCIPLTSLEELCFDDEGEDIDCGYSTEDILNFFAHEECKSENQTPVIAPTKRPLMIAGWRPLTPAQRFKKVACKKRRSGRFLYRCARLPVPFNRKCIYWRHMSKFCFGKGLFS